MPDKKRREQGAGSGEVRAKGKGTRRFIEALRELEEQGDPGAVAALFAADCTVDNVQLESPMRGTEGAQRYWRDYRLTFRDVRSRFNRITETGDTAVLEWVTTGTLKTGRAVEYRGASVLTFNGNEVGEFMAYFDTRVFTEHL